MKIISENAEKHKKPAVVIYNNLYRINNYNVKLHEIVLLPQST